MPERAHSWLVCLGAIVLLGCPKPEPATTPSVEQRPSPAPVLNPDDEALLASLLSDDPGDFHRLRARVWRVGPAHWAANGPEWPNPVAHGELAHALDVVVIDPAGPRVLLPLDELADGSWALAALGGAGSPQSSAQSLAQWSALRIVAVLSPGDLVAGLTRELHPTPWLTLAAGVGLTPQGRTDDHLDVHWSDPACGFSLALVLDNDDFGPLYEPGPAGPPTDPPGPLGADARRLAPGTKIYPDVAARAPVVVLDPETSGQALAQRVTLEGKPSKGRQAIRLECRGVAISGWVETRAIIASSASYAVVDDPPARVSSCANAGGEPIAVARATPLYEPLGDAGGALIGVVARDVELAAKPGVDGWWNACVGSPWGDMSFRFKLR
jgi:hypothetical protein